MASGLTFLLPIGAGLLLANRIPRDRSLHVEELLRVAPASGLSRLFGKYLGATLAVSIPILLIQLAETAYLANYFHDPPGSWNTPRKSFTTIGSLPARAKAPSVRKSAMVWPNSSVTPISARSSKALVSGHRSKKATWESLSVLLMR